MGCSKFVKRRNLITKAGQRIIMFQLPTLCFKTFPFGMHFICPVFIIFGTNIFLVLSHTHWNISMPYTCRWRSYEIFCEYSHIAKEEIGLIVLSYMCVIYWNSIIYGIQNSRSCDEVLTFHTHPWSVARLILLNLTSNVIKM